LNVHNSYRKTNLITMKISNKTNYGLRFMLNLALNYGQSQMTLNDIAEKENISEKFLESIAAIIKSKGLVKVKRGAKGGYELAKSPSQITIKELFDALESDFFKNEQAANIAETSLANQCVSTMTNNFSDVIKKHLESTTLETLVSDYNSRMANQMFYI
jgi:Rrf2 family transcriptional regulator, cysteine metabolism repressor